MVAFAGNSLLCRAALSAGGDGESMDPRSFTAIRIAAGALVLSPALLAQKRAVRARQSPGAVQSTPLGLPLPRPIVAGAVLFTYAFAFSASYQTVPTGAGALIMFGAVQLTMLLAARLEGDRLGRRRACGAILAAVGLVLLLAPSQDSLRSVDPGGAALMGLAGVAWGIYTLLGRGESNPTCSTGLNFIVALPAAVLVLGLGGLRVTTTGVWLSIASGAVCSGLGYALWYRALRGHSAVTASLSQLTVPVIAGLLGLVFLHEPLTLRWAIASGLVALGVGLGLRRPS